MESRQLKGSSSQSSLPNNSRVRFAEEDPGLEAVDPTPPPKIREEIPPGVQIAESSSAPEVYWADDRDNDPALSQYTFYREPTPPPPDYEERHKKEYGYSAAVIGGRASRMEDGRGGFGPDGQEGDDWSSTDGAQIVCGIRKRAFWTIIAIVILFFIALALGVGLGVGLTKGNAPPAPSATSSSSPATWPSSDSDKDSSPLPSPSTPTTSTSSALPPPTSTPTILPTCPEANSTLYTTTTKDKTKKTFRRICGIDYSGVGEAIDIKNVRTETFAECMDACAELSGCTGCGWGHITGDVDSKYRCWLKSDLGTPHAAIADWDFAVLELKTSPQP